MVRLNQRGADREFQTQRVQTILAGDHQRLSDAQRCFLLDAHWRRKDPSLPDDGQVESEQGPRGWSNSGYPSSCSNGH